MKKTFSRLFMLVLLLLTTMSASASIEWGEKVTFNIRTWDETNQKLVTTREEKICYLIGEQNNEWEQLGKEGEETWYAVKGNVSRKTLNIFGIVHLILEDYCTLTCTGGIKVETVRGAILYIHSQSDGDNQGKLVVTNSYKYSAGIGSGGNSSSYGEHPNGGDVFICGGNIDVTGGAYGAGIGGGCNYRDNADNTAGTTKIYGGKIVSRGGISGAGIGGGSSYNDATMGSGKIFIYGGDVTAIGGELAAGVGGGGNYNPSGLNKRGVGGDGADVQIFGGKLTAQGGFRAAGIGSGGVGDTGTHSMWTLYGCGGSLTVKGGEVYATGGEYGAGIGTGCNGEEGPTVEVHAGYVKAQGGKNSAGIGGGEDGFGGVTRIYGGTVIATVGENCDGKAKKGASAIGHGKGITKEYGWKFWSSSEHRYITSMVILDDNSNVKVTAGDSESSNEGTFVTSERVGACYWRNFVRIEPCNHAEYVYSNVTTDRHDRTCKHCGGNKGTYTHEYDSSTPPTCACGYKANAEKVYNYKIYNSADGKTYQLAMSTQVFDNTFYRLPEPFNLDDVNFQGYILQPAGKAAPTGIELTDAEESQESPILYQPGQLISTNYDVDIYARYRYAYECEWEWGSEVTEQGKATVKLTIKNSVLNDTKMFDEVVLDEISEEHVDPDNSHAGERCYLASFSYERIPGVTYTFEDWESYEYDKAVEVTVNPALQNSEKLEAYNDRLVNITIENLVLTKNYQLQPLCLPFSLQDISGTPLDGGIIYHPKDSKLENGELQINFETVTAIEAGEPYFVKWNSYGDEIGNPTFKDVIINHAEGCFYDENFDLTSTFDKISLDESHDGDFFWVSENKLKVCKSVNGCSNYLYFTNALDADSKRIISSVKLSFDNGDYVITKELDYPWEGEGTEEKPYIVKNAVQLNEMQKAMNGSNATEMAGKYFRQDANITFNKDTKNNFTPVKSLKAHYDGNGFIISGLNIDKSGSDNDDNIAALFQEMVEGSTVKNVIVRNSTFTGNLAAAIAGTMESTASVENCHVLKDVEVRSDRDYAGGVVALMLSLSDEPGTPTPTVTGCSSQARVISDESIAGGVVGWVNYGKLSNSVYLGNIVTHGDGKQSYAVAGKLNGTIENCYYTCPTLEDANAKLMLQYDVDNTAFLMMVNQRDKYLKTGKTDLADADISYDITLNGHTLYKDGTWNTLCLPFGVETFSGTPLEGATAKQLTKSNYWQDNKLELIFNTVYRATGGYLYFVKWTGGDNVTSPTFSGVVIDPNAASPHADYVDQYGTFKPVTLEADDKTVLYLGADNKLYYPKSAVTINSFHGYLKLTSNLVMGDLAAGVRSIELNFGDDTTGVEELKNGRMEEWKTSDSWYTLDGKKLQGQPTQKGVYIVNGRKVVIK